MPIGKDSPIRPRPTNPQVAHLDPLVAKVLLDTIDAVPAPPVPNRRSFEGDKRTEMAALMVNDEDNRGSLGVYMYVGWVHVARWGTSDIVDLGETLADSRCGSRDKLPDMTRHCALRELEEGPPQEGEKAGLKIAFQELQRAAAM